MAALAGPMPTALDSIKEFFLKLVTRSFELRLIENNTSAEEIEKIKQQRALRYLNLVVLSLTSIVWGDTTSALAKFKDFKLICALNIYFNFALASMIAGLVAASFPELAGRYLAVSGNGVLQGFIFVIVGFNIETFASLKVEDLGDYLVVCWATGSVSAIAITLYWTLTTEDPIFVLVVLRLVAFVFKLPWTILSYVLNKLKCLRQYLSRGNRMLLPETRNPNTQPLMPEAARPPQGNRMLLPETRSPNTQPLMPEAARPTQGNHPLHPETVNPDTQPLPPEAARRTQGNRLLLPETGNPGTQQLMPETVRPTGTEEPAGTDRP